MIIKDFHSTLINFLQLPICLTPQIQNPQILQYSQIIKIYCPDDKEVLALFNSSKRIHSNDYFSASGNIGIGYHTSRSCSKSIKDLIIDLTQWFQMTKSRQKINYSKVISRIFLNRLHQNCMISVSGDCIFKFRQFVASISVTSHFHKFWYIIFGGFLLFETSAPG